MKLLLLPVMMAFEVLLMLAFGVCVCLHRPTALRICVFAQRLPSLSWYFR